MNSFVCGPSLIGSEPPRSGTSHHSGYLLISQNPLLPLSCKQNWGIFYELRPLAEPCKFKGETQPTQFANRRGKHTFTAIHQTYCSTKRWVCAIPTQPLGKTEKGEGCRINRYVNSRGRQTREGTRAVWRTYARRHQRKGPGYHSRQGEVISAILKTGLAVLHDATQVLPSACPACPDCRRNCFKMAKMNSPHWEW